MDTVLVPGLLCSPRLYAPILPAVWQFGGVMIADTRRDTSLPAIAERLLDSAPDHFALVGLSMGGYIALEVMRQAPERVTHLALLSTSARPDTPEQTAARREQIEEARAGRFTQLVDAAFPLIVAPENAHDAQLHATVRAMAEDVGPEVYVRQQEAIIARPDSRPDLPRIACPTLVVHGAQDQLITPVFGAEIADGIPGARYVRLEHCGHNSSLEQPEAIAAALTDLLSDRYGDRA